MIDHAVALAPDDYKLSLHDIRGVVRALAGDCKGAIEDFKVYVEFLKKKDLYDQYGGRRQEDWIIQLENCEEIPFDSKTLTELQNEYE